MAVCLRGGLLVIRIWFTGKCLSATGRKETNGCRLRLGKDLTMYNRAKFYGPTSKREVGYTDYLTWEEESSEK